jgi:hypothetical protein
VSPPPPDPPEAERTVGAGAAHETDRDRAVPAGAGSPDAAAVARLEARLARRGRRLDALGRHLWRGAADPGLRWLTVAWAMAIAARLTLLEAAQPSWRLPLALSVVGALGQVLWGGRLFWALSAAGLAIPLFFLRDWLTQSVLLLLIAGVGALTAHRPTDPDAAAQARAAAPLLATARRLVLLTYWVAAFHKLNRDFFDTTVSCATDTYHQLAAFLPHLGLSPSASPLGVGLPAAVVATEVLLPVLLWRWPLLGVAVGLVFHLPMTLVLAPAFVFAMLVGYAALLGPSQRRALVDAVRAAPGRIGALGLAAVAVLGLLMGRLPPLDLAVKVLCLGLLLAAVAAAGLSRRPGRRPRETLPRPHGWGRLTPHAAVGLLLLDALTPYAGTQVQHTGAMLSNLRIDAGCWNHLIVPESLRRVDPYVRIDEASVGSVAAGTAGHFAHTEAILREGLWSTTALGQMRAHWCSPQTRPIALVGTFEGRRLDIPDLCAPDAQLPSGPGVFGGDGWFPGYLRLQKNLQRACPQVCVH